MQESMGAGSNLKNEAFGLSVLKEMFRKRSRLTKFVLFCF